MDILNGVDHRRRQRRDRRHRRPERCGQIDGDEGDLRPGAAARGPCPFDGQEITGEPPEHLVPAAWPMCPQERNVFRTLTVDENLEMGAYHPARRLRPGNRTHLRAVSRLEGSARQQAGELSGGQRQMVAIGRALMSRAEAAAARRADGRPVARDHRRDLRAHPRDQRRRRRHPDGRAECARRHSPSPIAATCWPRGANRFAGTAAALLANREVAQSFLGGGVDA